MDVYIRLQQPIHTDKGRHSGRKMLSEILAVAPLVKHKPIKENKNTLTVTQFKRTKQHFITAFHNVADMAVLIYVLLGTSVCISATLKIEVCRTPHH